MTQQEYSQAETYWQRHDEQSVKIERGAVMKAADEFLAKHNTCALATGCSDFVRCTPIEYLWSNGCFYLLSEGGLKFRSLAKNKNVCLAVFEPYQGFGALASIQVSGKAEIIPSDSDEYRMVLAAKKIPESAIRGLSHPMYLIKVVPGTMELLFSEFQKSGYDSRQRVTFENLP